MKTVRKTVKAVFFVSAALCAALFFAALALNLSFPKYYRINKGESFSLNSKLPVTAVPVDEKKVNTAARAGEKYELDLKIFGLIPFSTVNVEVVDKTYVSVLGQPFGMRVYTEGVLVTDTAGVTTAAGRQNPAESAGIRVGDYILSVNGQKISCNEELSGLVEKSGGSTMTFRVKRGDKTFTKKITPVKSASEGEYRVGIWIKDSSAGIGTLTFYSPAAGVVCGLGHGLGDGDTGDLLHIYSGQMVTADIVSVKKGKPGSPGELAGHFTNNVIADITLNADNGVYGAAAGEIPCVNLTQIAYSREVKEGAAQILCSVEGDVPRLYSCEVARHSEYVFGGGQNLQITVTDPQLLALTGGIVQGMSGSPVLQNGKLIAAVTHVLVDDPTKGYAAFAEDMLKTADSAAGSAQKKVS